MTQISPEWAADFGALAWFKSSYSGELNACVTIAHASTFTAVRDSKIHNGPALAITGQAWTALLDAIR